MEAGDASILPFKDLKTIVIFRTHHAFTLIFTQRVTIFSTSCQGATNLKRIRTCLFQGPAPPLGQGYPRFSLRCKPGDSPPLTEHTPISPMGKVSFVNS